jgi:hypothetical protein
MSDHETQRAAGLAGPVIMLISAAIFGYFGFGYGLTSTTASGTFVPFFSLLNWTLKISAIGFLLSAVLAFVRPLEGNLLYALLGLAAAALLAIVGLWDLMDQTYTAAIPPILALLFAAWNGYGSWSGLQAVLALRRSNVA